MITGKLEELQVGSLINYFVLLAKVIEVISKVVIVTFEMPLLFILDFIFM